jgi:AcrR family transcriptional regulator
MRRIPKRHDKSLENRARQLRAQRTREQLIDAARRVFARDGFDLARLEDIAAAAGKTRGAFYDHFQDKEDVFFAIFEENISQFRRQFSREFKEAKTAEQRLEALTRRLFHTLKDRRLMMLDLEFKIYAIRHPQRTKRLADLQLAMCLRGMEETLDAHMPELRSRSQQMRRRRNAQFGAILDGLAVNRLFDPESLSDDETMRFIRTALRPMLQPVNG